MAYLANDTIHVWSNVAKIYHAVLKRRVFLTQDASSLLEVAGVW